MTKSPHQRLLYGEPAENGSIPFWKMATLWSAASGKPATSVTIESLNILDDIVWFGGPKDVKPTIRNVADRARDIFKADLEFPIIMTKDGVVLDGAHRIAKAYLADQKFITAVILDDWPPPDGHLQEIAIGSTSRCCGTGAKPTARSAKLLE